MVKYSVVYSLVIFVFISTCNIIHIIIIIIIHIVYTYKVIQNNNNYNNTLKGYLLKGYTCNSNAFVSN